jgi:tetratricopeptide (TPR) repeat protein
MKARIYLLINLKKEAIGLLEEALKGDSTYSLAYYELAEVYANLKDYTQASVNYQKYIDASEVTIEKQKRLASFLFIDKQYSKSIKILESILSKDNNPESSIRILAYSYMRLEENEKSISYFKQLFDLNLESYLPTDYENYSDLLSKSGDEMQALEYLKKVVATDSSRKDVFGKMSVLYFKNKDWEGVVYSLENKGKLTAQEYFDLSKANIFIGDKNINSAYQGLPQKMDFDDEQTSQLRIALLYYQAELKEALNDSTKLVTALSKLENSVSSIMDKKQKPNWETLKSDWLNRVKAIVGTEYGKAESALTSLIEKVPTLAIAYIWQGRVKSNFDPDSEAGLSKPFYEKFIELSNNDVTKFKKELIEAYSYLGYYFYIKEDNTLALQNWEKVLELDPENVQATAVIKQLK